MKCSCAECNGAGHVSCPECDGRGEYEGSIENLELRASIRNYEELYELQKDAKRAIRQVGRLKQLRPERAGSYDAQLKATLFVINSQAERAALTL